MFLLLIEVVAEVEGHRTGVSPREVNPLFAVQALRRDQIRSQVVFVAGISVAFVIVVAPGLVAAEEELALAVPAIPREHEGD